MERTAGNHGLAAVVSNVNVSGKRPVLNVQRAAVLPIAKGNRGSFAARCKRTALDGCASGLDAQCIPVAGSLEFAAALAVLNGEVRLFCLQFQLPLQRTAV